jgi:hypothetical protein
VDVTEDNEETKGIEVEETTDNNTKLEDNTTVVSEQEVTTEFANKDEDEDEDTTDIVGRPDTGASVVSLATSATASAIESLIAHIAQNSIFYEDTTGESTEQISTSTIASNVPEDANSAAIENDEATGPTDKVKNENSVSTENLETEGHTDKVKDENDNSTDQIENTQVDIELEDTTGVASEIEDATSSSTLVTSTESANDNGVAIKHTTEDTSELKEDNEVSTEAWAVFF